MSLVVRHGDEKMTKVTIRTVDGGLQEYEESGNKLIRKLIALQNDGCKGKQLIHDLISDDWGVPPLCVQIEGKSKDGDKINVTIPYE